MQIRKAGWKIRFQTTLIIFACALLGSSCAERGVYHRVRKGQTLYRISLTYRVPMNELVAHNGIEDPFDIKTGQRIFIPGATKILHVPVITPSSVAKKRIFIKPVRGTITGRFGERRRRHFHKGVDIAAPSGTLVVAALSGKVVYAGSGFSGYGKTVIIDHQNGFLSLYSHLRRILTKVGRMVRQRDVIGKVGKTGRATGPHLHFEIRHDERLVNPLEFMIL
ncbi:MAG: peptidoglycan DD-metalloendopeptidase family protein [Deltaproteobacteria bacterium]|nr:peptidoglycan DD-metalloendopeptidase family protein [Deltaproteobacteria bacterium]